MGWQIHRIWSTDWFRDPQNEVQVLVKKLEKLLYASNQSTARSSVDVVSESANDVSRLVLSIPAKDWFFAAKWARQNDFLSGYQRKLLYMTGIGVGKNMTYNTAAQAANAYRELRRLGLPRP